MIKIFKALKYSIVFALTLSAFLACDEEFNSIDSQVLGEGNFNFNNSSWTSTPVSYNKKLTPTQVNNLNSSLLGFYDDPIYGQTTASFVTQVTPTTNDPDFGDNAEIESVILSIPYFTTATGSLDTDNVTPLYTFNDNVLFGNNDDASVKITIYRNNYFLSDFKSTTNEAQNYYSNAFNPDVTNNYVLTENSEINFDNQKGELLYQDNITYSNNAIVTSEDGAETKTFSAPALRINLAEDTTKKDLWTSLILEKEGLSELRNSNEFKNYFRGLYFKAEAVNNDGQMILLNTSSTDARITINYTNDGTAEGVVNTYTLSLTGNRTNSFINTFDNILEDGNASTGDEKLYLKGTEGSMAIVDLFDATQLESFKNDFRDLDKEKVRGEHVLKRLINEAHLVIYEDESSISPDDENHEFDRVYAYDLKNNSTLADYNFDGTENLSDPINSKVISLGKRITYDDEDGTHAKYKIRITEHLNNILIRDSTNTKIGLVLSNNVNNTNNSEILNSNVDDDVTEVPSASILSQRGTILHGNSSSVPQNRRVKLEIYFTE